MDTQAPSRSSSFSPALRTLAPTSHRAGAGPGGPPHPVRRQRRPCLKTAAPAPPVRSRRMTLAAHPATVPWARRLLAKTLREWELDGLADTALLLVSELMTNAVNASASCPGAGREPGWWDHVGLTVEQCDTCLLLEVWDRSPAQPVRQDPEPSDEAGRGLAIVEALSRDWGREPAGSGKVVWCELELPAAAGDTRRPA